MEPRCGKSKAALDLVGILRLRNDITRVAILCPKVALEVWDYQIKTHFPFRAELEDYNSVWTRNGNRRPGHTTRFYLLGYERAARRERRGSHWSRPYLDEVERWQPDVVILDESHRLKRAGGVGAQGTWRMVRRLRDSRDQGPFVLLLTGTPTPKGWIDIFAQYRILDSSVFGTAKSTFEERYCQFGRGKRKWTVVAYRHEKELARLTRAHSFRISQDQAGLARTQFTQNLTVRLPPTIRSQYDELATYFITQVGEEILEGKNVGAVRTRLLQLTGGFTTDGVCLHTVKVDKLRDYARVVAEQEEPLLVYCRFLAEVDASVETLRECGFLAERFTGATSDRDRRRAILGLRRTNGAIVFQAQAGSVALDLSAAAEVVFFSLPDGWESYWGDRNRVLGPGQRRPVRFTHLLAQRTVDQSVLRNLIRKEDQHASLMANPRRYLRGLI